MGTFMGKMKDKVRRLVGKVEQHQQAITFAEAGEHAHAQGLLDEQKVEAKKAGKLLVVSTEGTFSREVVNYTLEMAERMSYEVVALNTAPLACGLFNQLSSSQKKVCQEFQDISDKSIKSFQEEATRKGIHLEHFVKFSGVDAALEEIKKEVGEIDFVVSDNEAEEVAARKETGKRVRPEIFVYSMR